MQQTAEPDPLVVAFLDVGKGDSIVAIVPGENSAIVVDCPSGASEVVLGYLERAHINVIRWMIVTHSDQDHAGDVPKFIADFQSRYGGTVEHLSYHHDRVRDPDRAEQKKYRNLLMSLGQCLRDGVDGEPDPYVGRTMLFDSGLKATILHPHKGDLSQLLAVNNINDASVVVRLDYQGKAVLLAGDAQGFAWERMRERNTDLLKADVLKFPHHGAWFTAPMPLLEVLNVVAPKYVVISVGTRNGDGHPSQDTLRLLRRHGSIIRFVCTQATNRCHPAGVLAQADEARRRLPERNRGGRSFGPNPGCPCAGTVIVSLSTTGITMWPLPAQHQSIIQLFSHPQCQES